MTQLSESQTRSVTAIGDSCVIPGERTARDPGSKLGFGDCKMDSRFRGNDDGEDGDSCVIPGEPFDALRTGCARAGIEVGVARTSHAQTWVPAYAGTTIARPAE